MRSGGFRAKAKRYRPRAQLVVRVNGRAPVKVTPRPANGRRVSARRRYRAC